MDIYQLMHHFLLLSPFLTYFTVSLFNFILTFLLLPLPHFHPVPFLSFVFHPKQHWPGGGILQYFHTCLTICGTWRAWPVDLLDSKGEPGLVRITQVLLPSEYVSFIRLFGFLLYFYNHGIGLYGVYGFTPIRVNRLIPLWWTTTFKIIVARLFCATSYITQTYIYGSHLTYIYGSHLTYIYGSHQMATLQNMIMHLLANSRRWQPTCILWPLTSHSAEVSPVSTDTPLGTAGG
jgi:hypothetical protein